MSPAQELAVPRPTAHLYETLGSSRRLLSPSPSSTSNWPILLIVAVIVVVASAAVYLLIRFIYSRSASPPPSSPLPLPPVPTTDQKQKSLIDSLPLFTLAVIPRSSPDCAVCLSAFRLDDEIRLLPACSHEFHAACIDTWLKSTPSCPLCRSPILLPPPPPPIDSRSGSFRTELGSVSRRTESDATGPPPSIPHARSYSLGSSLDYVVEEEVEAVLAGVVRRQPPESKDGEEEIGGAAPLPPVAEAAGEGGRGWLEDYLDRMRSSASSSFSSRRWRSHYDGGGGAAGGDDWDNEMEESGFAGVYRWLWGA